MQSFHIKLLRVHQDQNLIKIPKPVCVYIDSMSVSMILSILTPRSQLKWKVLSDYREDWAYNLRIRGFSAQLPLTPPQSLDFQFSATGTRSTWCQMSLHTDCRVTTWIRNSNRTSIKVVDRPEPRQRQHKERQRARRYSQLKHHYPLEQTA